MRTGPTVQRAHAAAGQGHLVQVATDDPGLRTHDDEIVRPEEGIAQDPVGLEADPSPLAVADRGTCMT